MLFDFANVLVFTALGLGFVGVNLLIGRLLRPSIPKPVNCRPMNVASRRWAAPGSTSTSVFFVALIFIIFEVEIAFLFPVASVFRRWVEGGVGVFALIEILLFVGILFLGLVYAWVKGDLDWIKKVRA